MSASVSDTSIKAAWVVFLLTSPSYLPGILVLAHSLKKYNSAYPLIVAVNPALPKEAVQALKDYGLEVKVVEPLVPVGKVMTIAERFVDTWTKLRVFEFVEYDVSKVIPAVVPHVVSCCWSAALPVFKLTSSFLSLSLVAAPCPHRR